MVINGSMAAGGVSWASGATVLGAGVFDAGGAGSLAVALDLAAVACDTGVAAGQLRGCARGSSSRSRGGGGGGSYVGGKDAGCGVGSALFELW